MAKITKKKIRPIATKKTSPRARKPVLRKTVSRTKVPAGRKTTVRRTTAKKPVRKNAPAKKRQARIGSILKRKSILRRFEKNPILEPIAENSWESKATFNAGSFERDGKVYLLYRAIGDNDISVLGYARSEDGERVSDRLKTPAFFHKKTANSMDAAYKLPYTSGGSWNGGCEDPRLTCIDGRVYLTFTDFDGWGSLRIAFSSIDEKDFMDKNWDWDKAVPISPPGEVHKNWVMFPEKIRGKYAILHSLSPDIQIYYFDDPKEFDGKKFIEGSEFGGSPGDKSRWDSWVRGAGPPPIKTKLGWLVLYHAMDRRDPNRYKLGAMILDAKNPEKVLYRSPYPVLEPDENYENHGYKSGVIYSCGAAVMGKKLFVYYGGADRVTCVASADLDEFLKQIKSGHTSPRLTQGGRR